jgi:GNAT superfamily N-acetyltransferase
LGGIQVIATETGKALKQFVELPYSLYRGDPYWVPPLRIAVKELLDRSKHPFYDNARAEFFLALEDGKPVGRVAAILDQAHNSFHAEEAGFFGFFESVNNPEVASALLNTARGWLIQRGASVVRGPVSPSTNYECGLLVDGFDSSPMVMMTYNPRYYAALIEGAGFVKAKDLYAYRSSASKLESRKIERLADRVMTNGVRVRPIDMKHYDAEVERVWTIYNAAWSRNWGFVPASRREFLLIGKEMKQILKPELVLLGEVEGRVVGFALALPDINQALKPAGGRLFPTGLLKIIYHQHLVRSVRVLTLGVVEEYRASGLAAAFYATLLRNARKLGYHGDCEMSWILEDNVLMNRSLEVMGAERYKTYRIYERN